MNVDELFKKLKPNPKNPRTISDDNFERLKKSIEQFPQMLELRPIIYDDKTFISLGGNMRLRAISALIKEKGFVLKPEYFKQVGNLTEEQKNEFIIRDNISDGEWDYDALANEWPEQSLKDWGVPKIEWQGTGEQEVDEGIETKNVCPKCGYEF